MTLGWKWMLLLIALVAAAGCSSSSAAGDTGPTPDPYPGSTTPVTIVDSYVYLPDPDRPGRWVYCWRPAHAPADCQEIPHPPFDPDLMRKGIG